MKKNIALFTGVIAFVTLFYDQELGLNFSLFSLLLWLLLFVTTPVSHRSRRFWWLSAALLLSTGSFAWYGDPLSFLGVFCTLILTVCVVNIPLLNVLLAPFAGMINFASFIFRAPVLSNWLPVNAYLTTGFYKKAVYYFLIPVALAAGFLIIYGASSELFQSFFYINWNADLLQIGLLTAGGFFIMFCFMHYWVPALLPRLDGQLHESFTPNVQNHTGGREPSDIDLYRKSGEISLLLLNLLVIFFIITYCIEQFGQGSAKGLLSQELHERVYLLIFSILLAISVIILFFKGALNFNARAGLLKNYAFMWIALNMLLVIVVILKNGQYVAAYGLTFKRIGVYLFLLLSAIGLVFTGIKLRHKKTTVYLINRMIWTFYITLIIGCTINWSWIVTKYNLKHQHSFDIDYANSLPYNRQLLYDDALYQTTPQTKAAFLKDIQTQKNKPLLSKKLYYLFLRMDS